jgi:hypothetical protein
MRDAITTKHGTEPIKLTPHCLLSQARTDLARFTSNKGKGDMADRTPYGFHPKHMRRAKGDVGLLLKIASDDATFGLTTSLRARYIIYKHRDEMIAARDIHHKQAKEGE